MKDLSSMSQEILIQVQNIKLLLEMWIVKIGLIRLQVGSEALLGDREKNHSYYIQENNMTVLKF